MTWLLLIYDNHARFIIACYRLADYDGMPNLYVKIIAWCLCHLHNFKVRAWYNTLPNRDCEHGVLLFIEIITLKLFFWHLWYQFSFRFFAFLLTLHFVFLLLSTYLLRLFASQICSPFTICSSFLVLNWKVGLEPEPTYLSWSNMFFYNCYPCNQKKCSIKM